MNSELKILEALWDLGGEASFYVAAKTAGFSTDYARIICRTLGKNEFIDWFGPTLILRSKGKLEIAKLKMNLSDKEKRFVKEEKEAEREISRISKGLLPHHRIDKTVYAKEDYGREENRMEKLTRNKKHMVLRY